MLSPHGVELRKRRTARAERRTRERDELRRKKDEDEKMQKTLKELEEQRQVLAFYRDFFRLFCRYYSHKSTPISHTVCYRVVVY